MSVSMERKNIRVARPRRVLKEKRQKRGGMGGEGGGGEI